MNDAILRQVWPVFRAEAREIIQAIASGVLVLERAQEPDLSETVKRHAHSLKGSAASLAVEDLVVLAHAVEDALAAADPLPRLPRGTVELILRVLDAMDLALDTATEPGRLCVADTPQLVALLTGLAPDQEARTEPGAVPDAGAPAPAPAAVPAAVPPPAPPGAVAPAGSGEASGDATPAPQPGAGAAPLAPEAVPAPQAEDRSIRVQAGTLDEIGGFVESLALGHAAAEHRARRLGELGAELRSTLHAVELSADGDPAGLARALARAAELARELERQGGEEQREAMRQKLEATAVRDDLRDLRMVPAAVALEPLRRVVRDAAGKLGKQVELRLAGQDVKLDRRLVDALKDPLVHLVRNAVDHGIEPAAGRAAAGKPPVAHVDVRLVPRGHRVAVQVSDDGRGLAADRIRARALERGLIAAEDAARLADTEILRFVFAAGFSTAEKITSISGRGVGLDVVQAAANRLQGSVTVRSTPGQGATFELDLPASLAVSLAVVVRHGQELTAIPAEAVERVVRLGPADLGVVVDRRTARVGEEEIPFAPLGELLAGRAGTGERGGGLLPTLLLRLGDRRLAVAVDEVLGERELVVRTLGRRGASVPLLAGAAVLDDGRIVSVLNPAMLLGQLRTVPAVAQPARVVVADDSLTTRAAVKGILELAGYSVVSASNGEEAWQHVTGGGVELVVSDVQMPRLDGLGLARRIKAHPIHRAIPVILVTSLASTEDRRAGLEAGADAYLVKRDVQSGELLARARMLLPTRG